jgi:hypothetical protein
MKERKEVKNEDRKITEARNKYRTPQHRKKKEEESAKLQRKNKPCTKSSGTTIRTWNTKQGRTASSDI